MKGSSRQDRTSVAFLRTLAIPAGAAALGGLGVLLGRALEFCWVHGDFGGTGSDCNRQYTFSLGLKTDASLGNLKSLVWRRYVKPGNWMPLPSQRGPPKTDH